MEYPSKEIIYLLHEAGCKEGNREIDADGNLVYSLNDEVLENTYQLLGDKVYLCDSHQEAHETLYCPHTDQMHAMGLIQRIHNKIHQMQKEATPATEEAIEKLHDAICYMENVVRTKPMEFTWEKLAKFAKALSITKTRIKKMTE